MGSSNLLLFFGWKWVNQVISRLIKSEYHVLQVQSHTCLWNWTAIFISNHCIICYLQSRFNLYEQKKNRGNESQLQKFGHIHSYGSRTMKWAVTREIHSTRILCAPYDVTFMLNASNHPQTHVLEIRLWKSHTTWTYIIMWNTLHHHIMMATSFKRIFQDTTHLCPKKKRAYHNSRSRTLSSLKNRKQNHQQLEGREKARENDGEEENTKNLYKSFWGFLLK